MIPILTFVLGLLIGLYVSHHWIVVPQWDTERDLRKELKGLRTELYINQKPVFRPIRKTDDYGLYPVPHRTHSKVRFIPHPGDLLK